MTSIKRVVAVVPWMDLGQMMAGSTPVYWQLFKALYEVGIDVFVYSWYGKGVHSPWWSMLNRSSAIVDNIIDGTIPGLGRKLFAKSLLRRKTTYFKKELLKNLESLRYFDSVLFMGVRGDELVSLPDIIRKKFDVPSVYYDVDAPRSLPNFTKNSYLLHSDLSEFTTVIVPSLGSKKYMKELGAEEVQVLYYAVDPELFSPLNIPKKLDVFFYGFSDLLRARWITEMITKPSMELTKSLFVVGGRTFNVDLGKARKIRRIPLNLYRTFCCSSKFNLNIAREPFTQVYASSTCRLFELPAMGACVISNPHNGMEEWFQRGKEIIVANNSEEVVEIIQWLSEDSHERERIGIQARKRVLKDHTIKARADELVRILEMSIKKEN